jgi:hypothetical protein
VFQTLLALTAKGFAFSCNHFKVGFVDPTNKIQIKEVTSSIRGGSKESIEDGFWG